MYRRREFVAGESRGNAGAGAVFWKEVVTTAAHEVATAG